MSLRFEDKRLRLRSHLKWINCTPLGLLVLLLCLPQMSWAKKYAVVTVTDAYIELHTGPGRGYPIFHVIQRNEQVQIIKNKTDWFLVRGTDRNETEGWVYRAQMLHTFTSPDVQKQFGHLAFKNFQDRTGEFGMMNGEFEGSTSITLYTSYALSKNLGVNATLLSAAGEFNTLQVITVGLESIPFPDWKISPYFTMGLGELKSKPRQGTAFSQETKDNLATAGFGLRYYLTRRLLLTAAVLHYVTFIDNDTTGEFLEWKGGVSIFY